MIGIIIQLAISWLLVWFFEKKNLSVLGFTPSKQRALHFFLYFFIATACCSSGFIMKMYFGKQEWQLNPVLSVDLILKGIWWNLKSVLFEELIFRGVILYMLIRRIGSTKAIIISAIGFGIYHWFSFGIIGQWLPMLIFFVITGTMGLVLAYAYSKTFSLYVPIAIHFGWNFTQIFIFSQGPIGNGIFVPVNNDDFRTGSYFISFIVTFLPLMSVLLITWLLIKQQKQLNTPV